MSHLHGAKLPMGWKSIVYDKRPNLLEIGRVEPGAKWTGGYVTIDFSLRIFNSGAGQPYKHAGGGEYAGRNWKKQIIEDACEWLEKSMT